VRENFRDIEVMMITGYASIEGAVRAVKTGAEEYLSKPFTDEDSSRREPPVGEAPGAAPQPVRRRPELALCAWIHRRIGNHVGSLPHRPQGLRHGGDGPDLR